MQSSGNLWSSANLADAAECAVCVDDFQRLECPVHGLLCRRHVANHRRRQAAHQPNQEPAHAAADGGRHRADRSRGGSTLCGTGKQPRQGPARKKWNYSGCGARRQNAVSGKNRDGHRTPSAQLLSGLRFRHTALKEEEQVLQSYMLHFRQVRDSTAAGHAVSNLHLL